MPVNEVNKKEENQEVLGTVEVDDSNVSWDELNRTHNQLAKDIMDLQLLISAMATENAVKINADPALFATVSGFLKSVKDVAIEVTDIKESYIPDGKLKTGEISNDDEDGVMTYISANSNYISASEKLANLSSIAVTDIITSLKYDSDFKEELKELDEMNKQ